MLKAQGFDALLCEMWQEITLKIKNQLATEHVTLFLLDEETEEFWAIAFCNNNRATTVRLPAKEGIFAEVTVNKKPLQLSFKCFENHPLSQFISLFYEPSERSQAMLLFPFFKPPNHLAGIVQLIKPLKQAKNPISSSFIREVENHLAELTPEILPSLEKCQLLYQTAQRQQANEALLSAIRALSQMPLNNIDEILQCVSAKAQQITNAELCILWLFDNEQNELWTKIKINSLLKKARLSKKVGFINTVIQTGEPLNIGFDAYEHPYSAIAKQFDRKFNYRTCSLLFLPVFDRGGKLIGITQLINKKKSGEFPAYNHENWPHAPECWKASFNKTDLEVMQDFSASFGAVIQNAIEFTHISQQEHIQREILNGLKNGIIYADKNGRIVIANSSAERLLGFNNGEISLEGKAIRDFVRLEGENISEWFKAAIEGKLESARQQFYPERTLISANGEKHCINLDIRALTPDSNASRKPGVMFVFEDISEIKRAQKEIYSLQEQEREQLPTSDRKEISILFSGIRSFTQLLENLEDQEIMQMLKEYFESMTEAVFQNHGSIDKYIGDSIMAVFGLSTASEDHAWNAVLTAVEMRQRLVELNVRRVENGKPAIRIGIGINSDTAIVGNIGSSRKMEFTAIGDGVNLASQLEEESKRYGRDIIISENTYRLCANRIWAREIDLIHLKDTHQPVTIYELVGMRYEDLPEEKLLVIEYYNQGREYYRERQFVKAAEKFAQVLEISSWDKPAALHLERCQYFLQSPPPPDWDGVWIPPLSQEDDQ